MKIIQLHFCLLLWWGATDGFRDLLVDLGQNVSLGCEIDVKSVYWSLVKPSYHLVHILHSFASSTTEAQHSDPAFRERFSLQPNSILFIQNITVNELGVYYCISSQKSSNGTRLYTKLPEPDQHNQMEENQQLQEEIRHKDEEIRLWQSLFILSGLIMCILAFTVTGFMINHCNKTPNNGMQSKSSLYHNEDSSRIQKLYRKMQQNGHRGSTITAVEYTQLIPDL